MCIYIHNIICKNVHIYNILYYDPYMRLAGTAPLLPGSSAWPRSEATSSARRSPVASLAPRVVASAVSGVATSGYHIVDIY